MSDIATITVNVGPRGATGANGADGASGPSYSPYGTAAAPTTVVAAAGVVAHHSSTVKAEMQFVSGGSGAVIVTASPPITAPNAIGDTLLLCCRDATNTVKLTAGANLEINSDDIELGLQGQTMLKLVAITTAIWKEESRS